jgi:hypothetical protein
MGGPDKRAKTLTLGELTELRRKTDIVSKFLQEQLAAHLETLRPVISPERVFSKFLGAKGDQTLADRAFAQLQQNYRPFSSRPFDVPSEFDPQWLTLVGNRLTLYPWEYAHEVKTDRETKTITMASPVRWVVSFTSAYTLSQVRQGVAGKGERRIEHVRQFVVNALVTQLAISHAAGLAALFGDLRYQLQTDYVPDLPKLPLTTIAFGLPSFRPADDLILSATTFSGVPAFVELIDTDAASGLQDPLKTRLQELVR